VKYVLAMNREAYVEYLRLHGLVDGRDAKFIRNADYLMGFYMDPSDVIRWGGYQRHYDWERIEEVLPTRYRR